MQWEKCGKILDAETFGLKWFRLNAMTPVPYMRGDALRLFVGMCDEENRSRVGYIDLSPKNPSEIIGFSPSPVLDLGEKGMCDEDGCLPSSLLLEDGKLYFYYSTYQRQCNVPYAIFSGLAVSNDNGDSFTRLHKVPILDRKDDELFQRSAIEIQKIGDKYRIWYTSGCGWFDRGDKQAPFYDLKCLESDKKDEFLGKPKLSLKLQGDEYGLTMPQVWRENGIFKMIYSVRSVSKGYRLGYGESEDGIYFHRMDEKMEIDVSPDGFDSEMICFGRMITVESGTYLFYSGNHYGRGGIGYARLKV